VPISASEALADQGEAAAIKIDSLRQPGSYLVSAMLGGAYLGVAEVLLLSVTGPMLAASSPWTKLIQGLVFGVAVTFVVFAGAELCTSNMMTAVMGVIARRGSIGGAISVIVGSFVGNLLGAIVFAWLVHVSGVLSGGATPGHVAPGIAILAATVKLKAAESTSTLFFRGILCNFLVCLAIWMAARTKSDGAKIALIFCAIGAFVASGFEHVVADMVVYSLGLFEQIPGATLGGFGNVLLVVGLGNLVGGGLLIGATYGFLARRSAPRTSTSQPPGLDKQPATVRA
jgi:nitrite transporter NirC